MLNVLTLQRLLHFISSVSFLSVFFFFPFFVGFTTCLGTEVSSSILKINSGVFRGDLLQSYLVINVTGLVQFWEKLSNILPSLAS